MPTPSIQDPPLHIPQHMLDPTTHRSIHTTCPPEDDRPGARLSTLGSIEAHSESPPPAHDLSQVSISAHVTEPTHLDEPRTDAPAMGQQDAERDADMMRDTPSPLNAGEEVKQEISYPLVTSPSIVSTPFTSPFDVSGILNTRLTSPKYSSSYLRPGSKFEGTQHSDRQVYNVQVEIKYVDMSESFVCGYLRIEGLTQDHPSLTTYFEGEIIGTKYTFLTGHSEWGSSEKVDMQHWNRFPAWKPLQRQARRPDFNYKNFAEREHLFMRWKEYFLVPDHKVRTISGASFEGFYYICFNQITGSVSGIYFHSKSEKFQQLELKHVDDHGCMGAMEFR